MLISFLGSPASGKTTLAAMLFAEAKQKGISNTDLLTEQARLYIAEKRLRNAEMGIEFALNDEDQVNIMTDQVAFEEAMNHALPEGLVVTDTSPFNSLLYMPPHVRESEVVGRLIDRALDLPRMSFYCLPVPLLTEGQDANRVHDREQSLAIDHAIPGIVDHYSPEVWEKAKTLTNGLTERYLSLRFYVSRHFPDLMKVNGNMYYSFTGFQS